MGEIVNLRRARKRLAATAADVVAAQNRARHGRTAVQAAKDRAGEVLRNALLDGARIEPAPLRREKPE